MLIDYILSDSDYDKEAEKNATKEYDKWNSDIDNILTSKNFLNRDLSPEENLLNACWANLENGLAKVNTSNYNLIEKWAEKSYLSTLYFAESDIMKSERIPRQKEDEAYSKGLSDGKTYSKGLSQFIGDERIYKCWKLLELCFSDYMLYIRAFCPDDKAIYKALDHYCTLTFNKATEIFPPDPPIEATPDIFSYFASSPALKHFISTIGSGKDLDAFKERQNKHSHSEKLQISHKDKQVAFIYSKGESKSVVIIDDFSKLGHNAHQRKIARHILEKADKQCISNGYMHKYVVSFPLSDIIGDNLYKNEDTARRGFIKAGLVLKSASLTGVAVRKGKGKDGKTTVTQAETGNLFYHFKVKDNYCYVYLNEQVNWGIIFQNYTILPTYYMKLTDKGSDLLAHIFDLARQNGDKLKRGESFTVSYRNICDKVLNLPNEEEVKNSTSMKRDYKRWIIKPLKEEAIAELQAQNDSGYIITVHDNSELPITEFLNTGYIEIAIKEDSPYYMPLTAMDTRQKRIIADNAAKAENREIAIQTAVEMKKQSNK